MTAQQRRWPAPPAGARLPIAGVARQCHNQTMTAGRAVWMNRTRLVWTVLMAVALLAVAAPHAAAHSELVGSNPADGAQLTTAPTAVELTFNEPISDVGLQVVARGPDGVVQLPAPQVAGTQVVTAWPQTTPPGEYVVSYRVVSADGHPIDGTVTMTIAADQTAGTQDRVGQSAVPAAPELATPEPISAEQTTDGGGSFPVWIGVVAVIVGVGIGAVIARMMRARRKA